MSSRRSRVLRATTLPGEDVQLSPVVDDLTDDQARLTYADWLEGRGDLTRARFLRSYTTAFRSMSPGEFPSEEGLPRQWVQLLGVPFVRNLAEHGLESQRDRWLAQARPALQVDSEEGTSAKTLESDAEFPVGATKLHGLPDLPRGTTWPQARDCRQRYFDEDDPSPEAPCSFVLQIDLADLAGTQAARLLPPQGLLSVFSWSEVEEHGITQGCLLFTPDTGDLARLDPSPSLFGPEADRANALLGARPLTFSERLSLPEADPRSPFEEMRGIDGELYDRYWTFRNAGESNSLDSLLGHVHHTTGDNHLPDHDWHQLLCIENTIGLQLHFCIREEDLTAARFERARLTWVDFD
ncbi:MAG: DUF1963 domain-containing protein [Acidobacteriota bacterium]